MEDFSVEEFEELIKKHLDDHDDKNYKVVKDDTKNKILVTVNEDGDEIFERKKWMRTTAIFPLPMSTMIQIIKKEAGDMAKGHKMVKGYRVLAEEEGTVCIFFVMRIPIPLVSNRWSVIRRRYREGDNCFIWIDKTISKDLFEIPKVKKKDIEMRSLNIKKYEPVDDGHTKVTSVGINHMGGNIAKLEKVFEKLGGAGMMVKMIKEEIGMYVDFVKKNKERFEKKDGDVDEEVEGEIDEEKSEEEEKEDDEQKEDDEEEEEKEEEDDDDEQKEDEEEKT